MIAFSPATIGLAPAPSVDPAGVAPARPRAARFVRPPSPGVHVAILWPEYLDAILEGRKTIECRLSVNRVAPFGVIRVGDVIYFRQRAGHVRAKAIADGVELVEGLTPRAVRAIRATHNDRILGSPTFWRRKRASRYATLIHLRDVAHADEGPACGPSYGRSWFVIRPHRPGRTAH